MGKVLKITKITKEITIGEVIKKYPKSAFVFIDYGLHCVGCPAALEETIKEAAKLHQIDLVKFLRDLNSNEVINNKAIKQ